MVGVREHARRYRDTPVELSFGGMPPVAAGAETAEKLLGGRLYSHRSKFPRAVTSRRGNGQANKSKETPDMTNDTRTRATYSTISHTVLDDVLDAGVSSGAVHLYVVLGRYTTTSRTSPTSNTNGPAPPQSPTPTKPGSS